MNLKSFKDRKKKKSKNVENISIKYVQKSPKKLAAAHFMDFFKDLRQKV
jgi:hypothetical protein